MLIENLDVDRERDTFIDVNDNQKGVKPSLLKYLRREKSFVGQAALALMEDPDSVLHGRITIQKKEDWSLLLFGAIQECVLLTYDSAFVQTTRFKPDESSEHRAKAIGFLIQYWREVADSLPEMWSDIAKLPPVGSPKSKLHPGTKAFEYRLLEETGIRAMSRLASLIFRKSWIPESESPAWEKVRELVSRLKVDQDAKLALTKPHLNPDVEKLNPLLKSTGKAGVTTIYNYLEQSIIV